MSLTPISKIEIKGEIIKEMFFINISGGDKTVIIFGSGKVLVMPVYRECPVQTGTINDLSGDFESFINSLEAEKQKAIGEADATIDIIRRLK